MSTFTSPIKPLIVAMALGFSQYGLAVEPNNCDTESISATPFIVSVNVEDSTDGLTSFKEAWDFINTTCDSDTSYTIQFHSALYNDVDTPLLLANTPFSLDGNREVSLITDTASVPAGSVFIESLIATENLFTIEGGSSLTTQNVTIPTELVNCNTTFTVDTLISDDYDGKTSFDEAWDHINENCNLVTGADYAAGIVDFSITFDPLFNDQTIVLGQAPYKINDGINITVSTTTTDGIAGSVTLTAIDADQVIFSQTGNVVLDSNYEIKTDDEDLVLSGDNNSNVTLTNVVIPTEEISCASAFTINTAVDDIYDFESSFEEVWNVVSNTCPGSTEYSINFDSSFNDQILELTTSPYTINDGRIVNIASSTATPLTLQSNANDAVNVFTIGGGSQLSLSGLIIDGNLRVDRSASAITSSGSDSLLTLTGVTMKGFYATDDVTGAAISSSSPTVISNSFFDDNKTATQGGAVRISSADLTITNTSFTINETETTSNNNTDTSGNSDAGGAAIAFVNHLGDEGNTLTISGSTFTNNKALGFGGAILLRNAKTVTISDSTFTTNTSNNFSANAVVQAYGGAIALDRQADVTIESSVFNGNTAQRSGGAIYVGNLNSNGSLNVISSNLINNTAQENGAAIYLDATQNFTTNISQTSLNTNTAIGNGGALYVHEKLLNLAIENTTISANTANQGAGIFFEDSVVDSSSINHSTLTDNISTNNAGAIQATSSPVVTLSHNIISGNTGTTRQVCVAESQAGFDIAYSLINELPTDDGCAVYMEDGNSIVSATDPLLIPLDNNGGLGQTHYLNDTSPVIDMGNSSIEDAPEFDQRGSARISRGTLDMGAVEYGNLAQNDAKEIANALLSPANVYSQIVTGLFTSLQTQFPTDTLSYSIVDALPDGLTLDSTTNTILGTPVYTDTTGQEDVYTTLTVRATASPSGEFIESSFTMTVGYSAPVYKGLTSLAVKINSGLGWDLAKSTDVDNQTITYSLSGLPAGLSFDATNTVVGRTTLDMVENSPYTLELQSIDDFDTTITQLTLKIVDPDDVVIITDTESGAASLNVWLLSGLALIGLGGFRRRQLT